MYLQIKKFIALSLSNFVLFMLLINVKMPTIIGILTFMSRINFVLSWVEYEKFYNLSARGRERITSMKVCGRIWVRTHNPVLAAHRPTGYRLCCTLYCSIIVGNLSDFLYERVDKLYSKSVQNITLLF